MGDTPSRFRVIAWALATVLTSLAVLTGLAVLAGPAAADPSEFEVRVSTTRIHLQTGGQARRLTAVARFTGEARSGEQVHMVFHVPLAEHNVAIVEGAEGCQVAHTQMRCPVTMDGNEHRYSMRIGPPADEGPAPGEQVQGDGAVRLEWPQDPHAEPLKSVPYRVILASPATSVNEVSGKVFDQQAQEPLPGAVVAIQDSDDKKWETSTDADGRFRVSTSSEKPLTPGTFTIKISKKGFQSYEVRLKEDAGESIT
ncbi:MAG: hypothetical protein GEU94_20115, partial [Micromonosporaceae bacterium]|nr:hypothetical protein [Micromonosporaceae bacterium]